MELSVQWLKGQKLDLVPYIKTFGKHDIVEISFVDYPENKWFQVEFTIPDTKGGLVEEVGFIVRGSSFPEGTTTGYIHMNKFQVTGLADYEIDITKQKEEFGTVTPFSTDGGIGRNRENFFISTGLNQHLLIQEIITAKTTG